MDKNLAWIGHTSFNGAYIGNVAALLHREIDLFELADEGLEGITKKDYPLIIVSDVIASGFDSPDYIAGEDGHIVARYVVEQIRKNPKYKDTPIIVPFIGATYNPEIEFPKAGATSCFNMLCIYPKEFTKFLQKYLE